MTVLDKTSEIGILLAMGFSPRSIRKVFLLEGLAVGLLGVFFGLLGGYMFSYVLQNYPILSLPRRCLLRNHPAGFNAPQRLYPRAAFGGGDLGHGGLVSGPAGFFIDTGGGDHTMILKASQITKTFPSGDRSIAVLSGLDLTISQGGSFGCYGGFRGG